MTAPWDALLDRRVALTTGAGAHGEAKAGLIALAGGGGTGRRIL